MQPPVPPPKLDRDPKSRKKQNRTRAPETSPGRANFAPILHLVTGVVIAYSMFIRVYPLQQPTISSCRLRRAEALSRLDPLLYAGYIAPTEFCVLISKAPRSGTRHIS